MAASILAFFQPPLGSENALPAEFGESLGTQAAVSTADDARCHPRM